MKNNFFLLALFLSLATFIHADVSLNFSTIAPNIADGFRNSSGIAENGMPWAIVVNTSGGSDFSALINGVEPFDIDNKGAYIAPDLLYLFGNTTTPPTTVDYFEMGLNGSIADMNSVSYAGLSLGDPFAIVWFPEMSASLGSTYGVLTDPGFVIPENTFNQDYSALPVFSSGTGNFMPTSQVVPEPRIYALALGLVALLGARVYRRRWA